jgi:hypothetical protein
LNSQNWLLSLMLRNLPGSRPGKTQEHSQTIGDWQRYRFRHDGKSRDKFGSHPAGAELQPRRPHVSD